MNDCSPLLIVDYHTDSMFEGWNMTTVNFLCIGNLELVEQEQMEDKLRGVIA